MLDAGFGEGVLLNKLKDVYSIRGIEILKYAASAAKELLQNVPTENVDLEKANLSNLQYNIIVAYNVLGYLSDPAKTHKNLQKSLEEGGIFIGSVPNNQRVLGSIFTRITNIVDKTHISTFKISQWREVFLEAGYKIVSEYGDVPLTMNSCTYIKHPIWQNIAPNYIFVLEKVIDYN